LTEYIVVVALVALASAAIYQNFGEVLRTQTLAMSHTLAGDDGSKKSDGASTLAGQAQPIGHTLKTFGKPAAAPAGGGQTVSATTTTASTASP
jgi:hypothetical protein